MSRRCSRVLVKSTDGSRSEIPPPWVVTFDLRERETLWTDENKARLVQLIASDRLGIDREEMKQRLTELSILIPDIVTRYATMEPDLLKEILRSIDGVALKTLELKKAFPNANISVLIARDPSILFVEMASITAEAERTRQLLKIDEIDRLAEQNPMFLDSSAVEEVLEDLERLMPGDAKQRLISDPSLLFSAVRGKKRLGESADT